MRVINRPSRYFAAIINGRVNFPEYVNVLTATETGLIFHNAFISLVFFFLLPETFYFSICLRQFSVVFVFLPRSILFCPFFLSQDFQPFALLSCKMFADTGAFLQAIHIRARFH